VRDQQSELFFKHYFSLIESRLGRYTDISYCSRRSIFVDMASPKSAKAMCRFAVTMLSKVTFPAPLANVKSTNYACPFLASQPAVLFRGNRSPKTGLARITSASSLLHTPSVSHRLPLPLLYPLPETPRRASPSGYGDLLLGSLSSPGLGTPRTGKRCGAARRDVLSFRLHARPATKHSGPRRT